MERWHEKQQHITVGLSPVRYLTEKEDEKRILQQIIIFNICMSFTMKMLAVSVLVVAMMALTRVTAIQEAHATPVTAPPLPEKEEEEEEPVPESSLDEEVDEPGSGSEEEEEEETDSPKEGEHKISKRAVRCPCGWSLFSGRCYRYFPGAKTWALAQRHCQKIGGNLASVLNKKEEHWLKRLAGSSSAWIGFSDAQQEHVWLWVDCARPTAYTNWCRGQPDNLGRKQHCAQFNWSGGRCWDDAPCHIRMGYVCARH